jgi:diamine N-acetyltransferase
LLLGNDILRLRAPEPEDLEFLYLWENKPELWDAGNTRQPYSRFALKEYISQTSNDIYTNGHLRLMIEKVADSKVVGTVDLFDFDIHHSRIAFGLFVTPEHQGRGYATMALRIIEDYVFNFLKINQLYCQISVNNVASISMFEKQNFSKSVLKNWIKTENGFTDVIVFQQFANNL